jgi:hypothetical protein
MRAFFLVLLLANLAFFAWTNYYAPPDADLDPLPLGREVYPQRLPIVAPPPASHTAATAGACVEWGSFNFADLPQAKKLLQPLALGDLLSERHVQQSASWWVFMPPQGSQEGAQRKASELDDLGIHDYAIVKEAGPYQWSISLGAFGSQAAAEAHLAALQNQGVRTAEVGPRQFQVQKVWLRIHGVDAGLRARLKELEKAVAGSTLRDCAG